jgi:outer membrane protein OmpA-like peptidoglycan-associated protein
MRRMGAHGSEMGLRRSLLLLGALVALPAAARAQRGIDTHLFQPSVDSNGFFSVERAATLPAWSLSTKLTIDFANQPLSMAITDPTTMTAHRQALMDWQVIGHLGLALGLQSWLEAVLDLGASAQSYTSAYGHPLSFADSSLTRTGFYLADHKFTTIPPPNAALLDLRLGLKVRAYRGRYFGLGVLAIMTAPIGDSTAFLGESFLTFRPTLIADFGRGPFSIAINLGVVVRKEVRVLDPYQQSAGLVPPRVLLDVGDELTWSVGLGYRVLPWLSVVGEVMGLEPIVISADATRDRTIDLQGGLQFQATAHLGVFVGGGGNVTPSADRRDGFRAFAGVSWALGRSEPPPALPVLPAATPQHGDRDGDGIPDSVDRCPDEPEDRDGFEDQDGCPEVDNDHDGIPDAIDHCPNDREDFDGYEDRDGCPDLDNDGDGIPDAADRCPNEPETRNGIEDEDGCPDSGGVVAVVELILPELSFDAGKSTFTAATVAALNKAADRILAAPSHRIRIEGHADRHEAARGNAAVTLSQARAIAVREYLIKRGVDGTKLQAVGYGDSRPKDDADTPQTHALNRRVEFIVVDQ